MSTHKIVIPPRREVTRKQMERREAIVESAGVLFVLLTILGMTLFCLLSSGCAWGPLTVQEEQCEKACARELPSDMYLSITDGKICRCVPLSRQPKRGW